MHIQVLLYSDYESGVCTEIRALENAKPLLSRRGGFLAFRLRRQLLAHRCGLQFFLGLFLALSKHNGDRVLGLDAVHFHVVLALRHIVKMTGSVLIGFDGLVFLVQQNDVFPSGYEVRRVLPQVGDGRDEIFEWRVVGVVHEEGEDSERKQGAL